jgi:PTS system N-acetylglucosamine-specific IIC component
VDACTTRLRLSLQNSSAVDAEALRQLGARGLVRPSPETLQVVVGTSADQLAGEIRAALRSAGPSLTEVPAAHSKPTAASQLTSGTVTAQTERAMWHGDTGALLHALGGGDNVRGIVLAATRLRIEIGDAARLDRAALAALGLRGVAFPRCDYVHLIVGPGAPALAAALRQLLTPTARTP